MSSDTSGRNASVPRPVASQIDDLCDRFEAAWRFGPPPRIEDYQIVAPPSEQAAALRQLRAELVMIDMEYRWRGNRAQGSTVKSSEDLETVDYTDSFALPRRPLIEHYVRRYPELGSLDRVPDGMIAMEYRIRHRWGDRPNRSEFLKRFPDRVAGLTAALAQVDRELAREAQAVSVNSEKDLPRSFGRFELLELLGQGGMGTVYKARHTKLDKVVALKILPGNRMVEEQAVARFEREMKAVGKLEHPNIVQALDGGEEEGVQYLVMEYVEGVTLSQLVARRGKLPVPDACELARQAAIGLQHAHEQGLVHRDIKPSNLMLCEDGSVKLLDLGLARLRPGHLGSIDMRLTDVSQLMGTPDYMAPEQASDTHAVDLRADIYSLGCTLYKLLAGVAPYSGPKYSTMEQKLLGHSQDHLPSIQRIRPEVPTGLAALMEGMLAKLPDKRPATPGAVAEAIAPYAKGADLLGVLHPQPAEPPKPAVRKTEASPEPKRRPAPPKPSPKAVTGVDSRRPGGWRPRRPIWFPVLVLVGIVTFLGLLTAEVMKDTNCGTLELRTEKHVQVRVMQNGEEIGVLDSEDDSVLTLPPGEYRLKLSESDSGLKLSATKITVKRGERVIVRP